MGKDKTEANKPRFPAYWDNESTSTFCDCCIEEVEAGRRPGTHFSKAGWESLILNFSKAVGRDYDKTQLKNKWDALKAQWKLWKELIGKETDLRWSSTKNTIEASEEWWQSKSKTNPNLTKFRKKGIDPELEEKLDRMFMIAGNVEYGSSSGVLLSESVGASTSNDDLVKGTDGSDEYQATIATEGSGKKRTSEQSGTQTQVKKGAAEKGKVGGAAKMPQQIGRLVEVVQSKNSVKGMAGDSVPEAMELLEALPGGEEGSELWFFASDLFMSLEKRQLFCNIKNPEIKLQWLYRQRAKN